MVFTMITHTLCKHSIFVLYFLQIRMICAGCWEYKLKINVVAKKWTSIYMISI